MKPFTKAEIKNAQSVSLVDYCQAKGIELEGSPENPHLKEMDSLVLFPGNVKRQWQRFSTSEGGDAIKFVEYYYQLPFQEAVKELLSPEYKLNANQHLSQPMPSSPFIYQNYEVKDFSHAYSLFRPSIKKSYLKSFANSVYQLDQVIYLVLSRCGTGEKGKSFYSYLGNWVFSIFSRI
ncbi:hypothetical protein [Aerococcus christensenii]|uniref:hypothetical protein n=1 Tax=Aerococcus christensenii TaxID=87541 RepID=UPI0007632C0B|nr:hypothetical protein [Aerococcus christensenii]AMB93096.1 hypothetical protein AWM71_07360 [Aerococcus christensenii]